jgi:TolB-like protein
LNLRRPVGLGSEQRNFLERWKSFCYFAAIVMFKQLVVIFVLCALLPACGIAPSTLQSRQSTDIGARQIRRIAVVPPVTATEPAQPKVPFGAVLQAPSAERMAPENLAHFLYSALAALPIWQIVSESEVREVGGAMAPTSEPNRLRRIGEMVYADAVMIGRVQRYRERVGDEWGARSPASVAFSVDLIDVRRGDVVWSARFDETQKSLSESLFSLGDVGQRGVRWLTADQLAQEGARKAIGQLHDILARR